MRFAATLAVLTLITLASASRDSDAAVEDNVWVSLDSNGVQFAAASGSFSNPPALSSDGRFVAFETLATLTREGDINSVGDIFIRDTGRKSGGEDDPGDTPNTRLVSVATSGELGNNRSYAPDISGDASVVIFESLASNLAEGDNNNASDIFSRDVASGTTTRLSVGAEGGDSNGASYRPVISANGGFVGFCSRATNLVADDNNATSDAFVLDRATGEVSRAPVDSPTAGASEGCLSVALNDDGSVLVFSAITGGRTDVFVHERESGNTSNITAAGDAPSGISRVAISGDGNIVAFDSLATNLASDDSNRSRDVFIYERASQTTTRVSVRSDGSQLPGDSGTSGVSISGDGRFVVFDSAARGVIPGDTNGRQDVFRHEIASGEATLASANVFDSVPNDSSYSADINNDGSVVAYTSMGANIAYGDNNRQPDIFLRRTNFPASSGDGSGPVDTGAPEDGTLAPIPADDEGGVPRIAVIGGAAAAAIAALLALSLVLGRRGRA